MAQTVYKLFLGKWTEAWHQLSKEEQDRLLAQLDEVLEKAGGKQVAMCNSSWASEQWPFWGVEQFPSLEALQKHTELLNGLNVFRYVESMTVLGTEWRAP